MDTDNEHIDDSNLRKLNTQGGFKVPSGYFNRLSSHILAQTIGEEENINGVPPHYFEESKQAILLKTIYRTQPTIWYKRNVWKYAAAAVVIFTSTVGIWFSLQPQHTDMTAANFSDEEILYYLEHNDIKDIPNTVITFASTNTSVPKLTEEETYIVQQADEQLILEEL